MKIQELFSGLARAHGEYRITGKGANGKVKGQAATVASGPSNKLWEKHLAGEQGLGIIPIRDDDTCLWGCLDIDVNTIDHARLEKQIRKLRLPLLVCRSKSGGAHCFLLLREPVAAEVMREQLVTWSAWLGHGGCEVFPKQVRLANEKDVGNWLNMPYFGDPTTRYCVRDGKAISLEQFERLATRNRVTEEKLTSIVPPETDYLKDGPPCLQLLITQGFPEGTRNEGLFSLGVYCRLAYDDWEVKLEELNYQVMNPPLRSAEVQAVIKSLKRKDYHYRCKEPPLRPMCNKAECIRRPYGVGGSDCPVEVQGLTKLETRPPVWFVDVDGVRMQLSTSDLQDQRRFQRKCIETVNKAPTPRKGGEWIATINELLSNVEIVEAPSDAGPEGQFWAHLYRYLEQGGKGRERTTLLRVDGVYKEDGRVFFRSPGLLAYLDRVHFREFKTHEVWALLRKSKVKHEQLNIEGQCVQCWSLPEDET